ncbi:MAG: ATP-binding protein [Actinomycetota bacterium]
MKTRTRTVRGARFGPLRVTVYIGALAVAVAAFAALGNAVDGDRGVPWGALVPFLALLTFAEYRIVRVHYRNQVMAITLFEAALAPLLFTAPTLAIVVVVLLAEAITGVLRKNQPMKAAFNLVQFTSAAALGSIVFNVLRHGESPSPWNLIALGIAMTTLAVLNVITLTTVICLAEKQPFRKVVTKLAPSILFGWIVNTAFGVLFAAAYEWSPWTMGLFLVPLLLLHHSYRGYATAMADRARMAGMQRASRALAEPVDPRDAIPGFLAAVRECFDAKAVDLVLVEQGTRTVHRFHADPAEGFSTRRETWNLHTLATLLAERGQATRATRAAADHMTTMFLELEGWRDCLAAPLIEDERTLGVLCVYDLGGPEGFEEGELAVLETLAGEAARAILKASLLDTILAERQKLADIVGRTSDGILTVSPSGTIKTWNAALERITGHPASDMIGGRLFGTLTPRDTDGVAVWLERWAENDEALPADIEITTRAGETRWLSCSYTRVADTDGRPSMLIVVARDATEARELERLKDDFVATVSHELRTPLTPIKGWAVTLLQLGDHLTPKQREEGVAAILRHSERLERLITNILEVSKVERGLSDRRDAVVDVLAVADKTVGDFRAENVHREIILRAGRDRHLTRGDEVWIEQILSNLISNALKYSPADLPIEVSLSRSESAIEVSVTDRGPGIPESERERIFERFKRLGDHMTRSQGGTGLGLYIARQLARAIGGELAVHSTAGQGATFTLRLTRASESIPVAS